MTPFRNEKNTNWEGAFRVPAMIRWPGRISAGQRLATSIVSGLDWFPTLLAAAGDTGRQGEAARRAGRPAGSTYKVHLDGYNQLPYLTGQQARLARARSSSTSTTTASWSAMRYENWKLVFCEQRAAGHAGDLARAVHLPAGAEDVQPAHGPLRAGRHHLEHLQRLDHPSRRSWSCRRRPLVAQFIATFKEFPPRQTPSSFSVDQIMESLKRPQGG